MNDKEVIQIITDIREINKKLNTIVIETQSIKSDIFEIKEIIKEKEKIEKMSGGWWIY
tara:strand:+ start:367 stop:540 length:174 start_codon:yes stop_codon:yes gene_type:complete